MERLTKRIGSKACHYNCTDTCGTCDGALCFDVQQMVDRLAAYEDAEERGELVRLPCKVGDIVDIHHKEHYIRSERVRTFFIGHPSHRIEDRNMKMIRLETCDIPFDQFGETVILHRDAAEAALAKEG